MLMVVVMVTMTMTLLVMVMIDGHRLSWWLIANLLSVSNVLNAFLLNCSALPRGNTLGGNTFWRWIWWIWWGYPSTLNTMKSEYLAIHCNELVWRKLTTGAVYFETGVPLLFQLQKRLVPNVEAKQNVREMTFGYLDHLSAKLCVLD